MKNILLINLLACFILSSCTFQKRVHNRGFHIDWKSTKSTSAPQSIVKNQQLKKADCAKDKEVVKLDSVQTERNLILPEPTPQVSAGADLAEPIILPKAKENYFKKEFNTQKEQLKKMAKPLAKKAGQELNIYGILGLMFGIFSVIAFFSLVLSYGYTSGQYQILSSIFFSIASVLFSGIALSQFKNNPDKWSGKGFAIAGLILGIGILLIWLFFLLLIFLLILAFGGFI
ncbi:MAG: hypothetical protein ACOVK9_03865 [Bacteroidia bacterium]